MGHAASGQRAGMVRQGMHALRHAFHCTLGRVGMAVAIRPARLLARQWQQFGPGGDEFLAVGQPAARDTVVDTTAPLDANLGQGIASRDFIWAR